MIKTHNPRATPERSLLRRENKVNKEKAKEISTANWVIKKVEFIPK
jgi:hypothetical protein